MEVLKVPSFVLFKLGGGCTGVSVLLLSSNFGIFSRNTMCMVHCIIKF